MVSDDFLHVEEGFPVDYETDSKFVYVDDIARGSTAYVEEVKEKATGRCFARKRYLVDRPKHRNAVQQVFANEVKTIRGLEGHAHFVRVRAAYATNRGFSLIMDPKASDGDLAKFLDAYLQKDLSATRRVSMTSILARAFGCLASGLAFMHQHRIRHKDVKPRNILIHQGMVYWIDFGYAKDSTAFEQSTTAGGVDGGITNKYAAWEVLSRGDRNSKADIFSLACVYLEIYFAIAYNDLVPESESIYAHKMSRILGQLAERPISHTSKHQLPSGLKLVARLICWMGLHTPNQRPDADTVCLGLNAANDSEYGCDKCRAQLSKHQMRHGEEQISSGTDEMVDMLSAIHLNDASTLPPSSVAARVHMCKLSSNEHDGATSSQTRSHASQFQSSWTSAPFETEPLIRATRSTPHTREVQEDAVIKSQLAESETNRGSNDSENRGHRAEELSDQSSSPAHREPVTHNSSGSSHTADEGREVNGGSWRRFATEVTRVFAVATAVELSHRVTAIGSAPASNPLVPPTPIGQHSQIKYPSVLAGDVTHVDPVSLPASNQTDDSARQSANEYWAYDAQHQRFNRYEYDYDRRKYCVRIYGVMTEPNRNMGHRQFGAYRLPTSPAGTGSDCSGLWKEIHSFCSQRKRSRSS